MTTPYCSIDQVKAELNASASTDDAALLPLILRVSARIDAVMGAVDYFAPVKATRTYPVEPHRVSSYYNLFKLYDNLLVLDAVSIGTEVLTVGTQVKAYSAHGNTPYRHLQLTDRSISWYSSCMSDDTLPVLVEVKGVFGFRRQYATQGWIAIDTLSATANSTQTTITVGDADGADEYGLTPRFSIGNLIQINQEWMLVTGVNTTTNVLTVRRAVNGSTASAHSANASVSVFRFEEVIARAAARQAAFLYARRGAFEGAVSGEFGTVTFPQDLLSEIKGILQDIQYG